jgi:hypothetical protein
MSYVKSHLVPGETVIYETRLHWIVMLGHIVLGCLLLALPGAFLLYYAASQTGIESRNLHIMEGGGVARLRLRGDPHGHGAAERDGNGADEPPRRDQNGLGRS